MTFTASNADVKSRIQDSEVPVPWCGEFDRMINGMSFSTSNSEVLMEKKLSTLQKLNQFNDVSIPEGSTLTSLKTRRMAVAQQMLGRTGNNTNIEPAFFVTWGCNIFLGDNVYINRDVSIYDNSLVEIGDRVLIGPGVCICTGTHPSAASARKKCDGTSFALPIIIEADCWIGARATILPGIRIGKGTTVAAGAVVTRDVAPGCLVGGVPAKVIRNLD
ncbi:hypothetical protein N7462_009038 [Penicillium macrosclerotiorum]|uniref:uncharacterized protein n=1 Tax=Penicillium macrosclerotiorum TaxID=303699 RepID=UPI002547A210|nr:uncharacterized protein N7462_009038 [Penicillium macrosclerotiorum]KAJ5676141.1 hypothetical protein N7462_009038 [Penicillium macrosclerotiorum]